MSSSFHPGRVATALVTAFLLSTFGLPLLREARLERRAAALREELAGRGEAAPAPPPWQERWEASLERIGRYLDAAPERPGLGYDGIPPADREALVAWAEGLRRAAPELAEIVAELRRFPPAEVPHLARSTKLLGTREWQNTILLEAELAAEAAATPRARCAPSTTRSSWRAPWTAATRSAACSDRRWRAARCGSRGASSSAVGSTRRRCIAASCRISTTGLRARRR